MPITDECRIAFEKSFDAAYDAKDFSTFNGICYGLTFDESTINSDWSNFTKGWQAAWNFRNSQSEPAADLEGALRYCLFAMESVLCDPESNPVFQGSDGDREAIRQAIIQAKLALSSMAAKQPEPAAELVERVANSIDCMLRNWREVGQQEPSAREIAKAALSAMTDNTALIRQLVE